MINRSTSFAYWLLCALAGIMLTACGGGDNQLPLAPGGTGGTTPPVVVPTGSSLSFSAPAASAELEVNTSVTVTVTYLDDNGAPKVGETVYFTASRGTLSADSAITNASGKATVTIQSSSAGQAAIKANTTGGVLAATQSVLFVSKTPASISVQAESTTLNTNGATTITATVLDSSGNPVKGRIVGFTLVSDSSGGTGLSDATATTNALGKASVTYTAGTQTTATNGVEIRASVQGSTPAITTNPASSGMAPLNARLTVSGSALFIAIDSTNTIAEQDSTHYALPYGIHVTDASGNPVANKTVTLSIIPVTYMKGAYAWNGSVWAATSSTPNECNNEDFSGNPETDLNGILDDGEDFNSNAMLEPGNPVSVTNTVITDANGIASFNLVYGKNYANWVRVKLTASTSVSGSESVKSTTPFVIPAMSSDVNSEDKAPPGGGNSPFGIAPDCSLAN